jgi:hypothetical protein
MKSSSQPGFQFEEDRSETADHVGPNLERWLPIDGWPGYDVSAWGRVRSWWGGGGGKQGQRAIIDQPKLIGNHKVASGHRSVLLYRNQSTEKWRAKHHTLVLQTFVGSRPKGKIACHNNGDPCDNRIENLRWDSYKSNQIDRLKHGKSTKQVLTDALVSVVWKMIVEGRGSTEIARDLAISVSTVSAVRSGLTWTHITSTLAGWPLIRATDSEGKQPIFVPAEIARSTEEHWKLIENFPAYRISSFGRIQSRWERVIGGKRGEFRLGETWKVRVCYPNSDGHHFLWMSNGQQKGMKYLHQLVLAAFACPRPPGYVGCHIDGNKSNNHASNLRWDTIRSNARDRTYHASSRALCE